jgi:hypothetical protein
VCRILPSFSAQKKSIMQDVIRKMGVFEFEHKELLKRTARYPIHREKIKAKFKYVIEQMRGALELIEIGADEPRSVAMLLRFKNESKIAGIDTVGDIKQKKMRTTSLLICPAMDGNLWIRIFKGDFGETEEQHCILDTTQNLDNDVIRAEDVTYIDSILADFIQAEIDIYKKSDNIGFFV